MGQPYDAQVGDLQSAVADALHDFVATDHWLTPFRGPESHFRNKAKLVVGGTRTSPTFGILDHAGRGVDLGDCGLYEPGLHRTIEHVAAFVAEVGLTPYDVPRRSGELKHLLITHSPAGESMVRFVLRSPGQLPKLQRAVPELIDAVPGVRVVTANLLPEHKAALEGDTELTLTEQQSLAMPVNDRTLHLRPGSFFQTNTAVAAGLYRQVGTWAERLSPTSVADLFCGVGGFALHAAGTPRSHPELVRGVESSADAVESARSSAAQLPERDSLGHIEFHVGDAHRELMSGQGSTDLVIVNPPRRGIGALAAELERSSVPHVIYSSCNATSLAKDLAGMPSYRVQEARLFDMFPQTRHHEVLVRLERVKG
nr:methyltransferase domain-containing protein [Flexivirga meconopsidis]